MKRRGLLGATLGATAIGRAAHAAAVEWKMHCVWVPARPEAISMKEFAEKANSLSEGTLNITVYDSGSLGIRDVDMLRVLPSGATIQAAGLSPAYLARDVPELPFALPVGVLATPDDALKLLPTLDRIYRDVYSRHGIRAIGLVTSPVRNTHIFSKEPINTLAALRGKKLRVWGKFQVDTFASLGVSGQIIAQGDMYLALQTGVIDSAVYAMAFAKSISLQEVAKYVSYLHPYTEAPLGVIVSERAFAALPPKAQQAVTEAGRWITERTAGQFRDGAAFEERAAADMRAGGVTIMPDFPEADQQAYLRASREVWLQVSRSLGSRGMANYEAINAALA